MGGPGRLPAPSPRSVGGAGGRGRVGGPGLAWGFEQGRGVLWQASRELKWQVFLASKFGGLFSWVNPTDFTARYFGGSFWRIYLAGHFGAFIWRVFTGNEISKLLSKGRKQKEMYNQ